MIPDGIPRKLHFIWVGNDFDNENDPVVLEKYIENMLAWREMHPDFDCKLWGDKEVKGLILRDFPELQSVYKNYGHAVMRADLARILILEKEGGVYIDVDVEPKKNLEALLKNRDQEDRIFVPGVQDRWMRRKMSNWLIIGKPNLPDYGKFREKAIELQKKTKMKWLDVIEVHRRGLSPRIYDQILSKPSMLNEAECGNCGNCDTVLKTCENPGSVYFVHDYDGSWTAFQDLQPVFCSILHNGPVVLFSLLIFFLFKFIKWTQVN